MVDFIHALSDIIAERQREPKAGSYTSQLLDNPPLAAQKVGEEGVEVVVAALSQDDDRLLDEAADLVYHLLVLLAVRRLSWTKVVARLAGRHRGS